MFEAPPHRCEPRHNPGFGVIRCECALSARNGRSGQNPNCGTTNTKNAADARLPAASADPHAAQPLPATTVPIRENPSRRGHKICTLSYFPRRDRSGARSWWKAPTKGMHSESCPATVRAGNWGKHMTTMPSDSHTLPAGEPRLIIPPLAGFYAHARELAWLVVRLTAGGKV